MIPTINLIKHFHEKNNDFFANVYFGLIKGYNQYRKIIFEKEKICTI